MQKCRVCNIDKPLTDYNKSKRYSLGVYKDCRKCCNAIKTARRKEKKEVNKLKFEKIKNIEKAKCSNCYEYKLIKEFYFENRTSTHTSQCSDCIKEKVSKYRNENIEKVKAQKREKSKLKWKNNEWTEEELEKRRKITRKWRAKSRDHISKYNKTYKGNNKGLCKYLSVKRRSKKIQAQPDWTNIENMKKFYERCPEGCHVDHIIPLQHPDVCGLNVMANLQYLPSFENMSKSNKFDYTYENESWKMEVAYE